MFIRLLYSFFPLLFTFTFLFLSVPKASAWFYLWFNQPSCSINFSPPSPVRVGNPFTIYLYSSDSLGLSSATLSGANIPGLPQTWPIPPGYTSAANNFTFYPSSSGTYIVTGTVTNSVGNSGPTPPCQATFAVNPSIPSAPYNLSASCPAPGSTATLSWRGPTDASRYSVRTRSGGSDTYRTVTACNGANCTNQTSFGTTPGTSFDNWGVQSCNDSGCSAETTASSFYCSPSCNTDLRCSGGCSAPSNTCQTNNGTLSGCYYWGYSGGGSCTLTSAPNQPCTTNACVSPRNCINPGVGATCQFPPTQPSVDLDSATNPLSCNVTTYTGGTISWTGYPMYNSGESSPWGFWVNVSTDPSFSTYSQKWVGCDNRSNPNRTCSYDFNSQFLTFDSGQTYYARIYNGGHSTPNTVFEKTCPPSAPSQAGLSATCSSPDPQTGLSTAYLYWNAVTGATYYRGRVGSRTSDDTTFLNATISSLTPNTSYSWGVRACNTGGCSGETDGSPPLECKPNPAFLKTTGGDVHSNR